MSRPPTRPRTPAPPVSPDLRTQRARALWMLSIVASNPITLLDLRDRMIDPGHYEGDRLRPRKLAEWRRAAALAFQVRQYLFNCGHTGPMFIVAAEGVSVLRNGEIR